MAMQKCWSLFNQVEKLRIDELSAEQVRTILLAIPTARMRDWYACREGDVQWQPLTAFPDFYEDVRDMKGEGHLPPEPQQTVPPAAPPQPPRRPLFEDATEATGSTLQMESVQTRERRSARRYARRLTFRTIIDGHKFECLTVDVSMGGLSLSQPLPPSLAKNFRATLNLHDQALNIVCTRVSDNQLKIVEAEAWDLLRQWIANW